MTLMKSHRFADGPRWTERGPEPDIELAKFLGFLWFGVGIAMGFVVALVAFVVWTLVRVI